METKVLASLVLALSSLGALADPINPAWENKLVEGLEDQERHGDHEAVVYDEKKTHFATGTENFPSGRHQLPYEPPHNYAPRKPIYDPPNFAEEARPTKLPNMPEAEQSVVSAVSSEPEQLGLTQQSGDLLTIITDYMTLGYNYLDGNPEGGSFLLGGKDPGLRSGRRVFKLTYALGKKVYYNGMTLEEPDQVEFQNAAYCSSEKTVHLYTGTSSYQKKLDLHVSVSASYSDPLESYRFSASAGYMSVHEGTDKNKEMRMDKEVHCNIGTIDYQFYSPATHRVTDTFCSSVISLPAAYDTTTQPSYMGFLDYWGTDFITNAELGGSHVDRFRSSYKHAYEYASQHATASLSAGGSYAGYSASLEVDTSSYSNEAKDTITFDSKETTLTSGSTIEFNSATKQYYVKANDDKAPVPMKITIARITDAFDPKYWTGLTGITSAVLATKRANLVKAIVDYPAYKNAIAGADQAIKVPVTWPDGFYGIPKPVAGCPFTNSKFTWSTGTRRHDTEDDDANNYWTSGVQSVLGGMSQSSDSYMQVEWCVKTMTSGDTGYKWPPGSYCIGQKQWSCPKGFSDANIFHQGYFKWDDEDDNNKNSFWGVIPDGWFTHDTGMDFCCRNDRHPANTIHLPTDSPFFLLRSHIDGCQVVNGRTATMYQVRWDDEDDNNKDQRWGTHPYDDGGSQDHRIYFCYYN